MESFLSSLTSQSTAFIASLFWNKSGDEKRMFVMHNQTDLQRLLLEVKEVQQLFLEEKDGERIAVPDRHLEDKDENKMTDLCQQSVEENKNKLNVKPEEKDDGAITGISPAASNSEVDDIQDEDVGHHRSTTNLCGVRTKSPTSIPTIAEPKLYLQQIKEDERIMEQKYQRQLKEKDERIAELQQRLEQKHARISELERNAATCPICQLCTNDDPGKPTDFSCRHCDNRYHVDCLQHWFVQKSNATGLPNNDELQTCPVCQRRFGNLEGGSRENPIVLDDD